MGIIRVIVSITYSLDLLKLRVLLMSRSSLFKSNTSLIIKTWKLITCHLLLSTSALIKLLSTFNFSFICWAVLLLPYLDCWVEQIRIIKIKFDHLINVLSQWFWREIFSRQRSSTFSSLGLCQWNWCWSRAIWQRGLGLL